MSLASASNGVGVLIMRNAVFLAHCMIASFSVHSTAGFSQALDMRPLSEARSELKAPAYTPAQRKLMAQQALLFIKNMYVHRELKIKDFGTAIDPVPRLEEIVRTAEGLSDSDFQVKLQRIFLDLHDNHTNYMAPLPLRCSYVISPLSFRDATENGKTVILFDRVSRLFADVDGEHTNAVKLDELVAVDGQPIDEYLKLIHADSAGANTDAMTVYGLMNFSIRSLSSHPVPKSDKIVYTLRGESGTYDITSDYYAIVNESGCVAAAQAENKQALAVGNLEDSRAENPTVKIWKKYIAPAQPKRFADDILGEIANVQDIKTPAGLITFMQLFSFMPEESSVESLIHRVRDELKKRQPTSHGLVIDLRGNGGGAIKLAEEMVQLFTPSYIEPSTVRLLPNELNLEMFLRSNNRAENGWTSDIRNAIATGKAYTTPRALTTIREANRSGQVWFKPVVILVDAACYSACDLFAAGMQDHGAATVIGTHNNTGAGGANVMEYTAFQAVFGSSLASNPFKKLPGLQNMRVSWRQSIRVGKHSGELIENAGVKPDLVVRASKADLARGESFAVMKKIKEVLDELHPRYIAATQLASSASLKNGTDASWTEDTIGVDSIEVRLDGKLLKTLPVNIEGDKVSIELKGITGSWENRRFDVIGKINGNIAFRVVRELFWRGNSIEFTRNGLEEDFNDGLKFLKTNVSVGVADDGWQVQDGGLRVGSGPNYSAGVVTETFIPLDVTKFRGEIGMLIDFDLQSEDGMDTFSIMVRDPATGAEQYLYTLDGTLSTGQKILIPIPRMSNKMEIVLEFESDENWNMTGPIIKSLAIEKMPSSDFFGGFFNRLKKRLFE